MSNATRLFFMTSYIILENATIPHGTPGHSVSSSFVYLYLYRTFSSPSYTSTRRSSSKFTQHCLNLQQILSQHHRIVEMKSAAVFMILAATTVAAICFSGGMTAEKGKFLKEEIKELKKKTRMEIICNAIAGNGKMKWHKGEQRRFCLQEKDGLKWDFMLKVRLAPMEPDPRIFCLSYCTSNQCPA